MVARERGKAGEVYIPWYPYIPLPKVEQRGQRGGGVFVLSDAHRYVTILLLEMSWEEAFFYVCIFPKYLKTPADDETPSLHPPAPKC